MALALGSIAVSAERSARAESVLSDPYALPEAPKPPTLPELTHKELEVTFESTSGQVGAGAGRAQRTVLVYGLAAELPIVSRFWFVGASYAFTTGTPGGSEPFRVLGGNLSLYGRTVWATRTGLAFGAGLAVLAPVASYDPESPLAALAEGASTMRPWDYATFLAHSTAIRPSIDVRFVNGPFVVQLRPMLDFVLDTRSGDLDVGASITLYLGYRVTRVIGVGLEAIEYYRISAAVPDEQRAQLVVGPTVHLMTKVVRPTLTLFTGIGEPLTAAPAQLFGVRLGVTVLFDVN